MNPEKPSIFLSYSSRDKANVRRVAADLHLHGVNVWLDEWKINVGQSITQSIQAGIEHCKFMGIWLTSSAVESSWVEREWISKYQVELAQDQVAVLPLLGEDCEIPLLLRGKKYADFRSDYHSGLLELLTAIFPGRNVYIEAIRNIRNRTTDLWEHMRWLPTNRHTSLVCEIRESILALVQNDLNALSSDGRFFTYAHKVDYQMETGENVHALKLNGISPELFKLIDDS